MTAAIVYCGANSDSRDLRVVADHHRHRHRLAERAAEAEHDRADDAGARVEERRADRLEARRAERVGAFALRDRHRLQHFARDRRGEGDDHDGEDQRGRQHADAERRTAEERQRRAASPAAHVSSARTSGHQHEDAPQAVDDRRNRGQQLGQEHQRLPQPRRAELGDEDGDAERDRRRDEQREDRRVERAPDERQRAELARRPDPRSSVRQKSKPNFWIDSIDWRVSSKPIADDDQRRATTRERAPVPELGTPRSLANAARTAAPY